MAARIWRPQQAVETSKTLPAILEFIPYRRRDRHRGDDAFTHPGLAALGYACVRVDMRGSGDSDGLMYDEYTAPEWKDACEVIAWIAEQAWCSGNVGMMGLSWGGFNSLQVAACRPPALKAVVSTCASDDRFRDDMHYMGGCLLGDNLQYGSTLFTWLPAPPDPRIVGEKWREMWQARLEVTEPPALRWMQHSTRDAYWQSGSVCEDYSRIEIPVLAVSGWADGYTNAVMRLLTGLSGPRKGLIGPWGHAYPHVATPGPSVDFLAYLDRWFGHWLKGEDTGLMDEPMLSYWLQESEPPQASYAKREGGWHGQQIWPPQAAPKLELNATSEAGLSTAAAIQSRNAPLAVVAGPADAGTGSGEWCPYGWGPDMPVDQREDDSYAACFETEILEQDLSIVGGIEVEIQLTSSLPEGVMSVRLTDIAVDGSSRRITYGLSNLALSDDYAEMRQMQPGQAFTVKLRLNDVAYRVPVGHKLRLAIGNSYWPLATGVPVPPVLGILAAKVTLPLLDPANSAEPTKLGPAVVPQYPQSREIVAPERGRAAVTRHLGTAETTVDVVRNLGAVELGDVDLTLRALGTERYTMPRNAPETAHSATVRLAAFHREDWNARIETKTSLRFEGTDYRFTAVIEAFDDEAQIFRREWDVAIPRPMAIAPAAKD